MRRFILFLDGLILITLLAIAACGGLPPLPPTSTRPPPPTPRVIATPSPGDRQWTIAGDLGTTQVLTGSLVAGDREETLFLQVSGLVTGSPSSGSRAVTLRLTCPATPLSWRYRPVDYTAAERRSPRIACDEPETMYFSYDNNFHRLYIEASPGTASEIEYTLTAEIRAP